MKKANTFLLLPLFAFAILVPNASAQEYDSFNPSSFANQNETIPHPPILIDIKDGKVLAPAADSYNPKPKYEYDENGNLAGLALANKSKIQIVYDARKRVNKVIGPGIKKTIISYPSENARIAEQGGTKTIYEYSADRKQLKITDGSGNITIKEFDADNHLIGFTDPAGVKTSFSYDRAGNLVSFVNGLGQEALFKYDDKNRLTSFAAPGGRIFQKSYDENGNFIQFTNPSGCVNKFSYNDLDKVSAITNARGYSIKLDYDPSGYPAKLTDPLGDNISMNHDLLGRIVKVTDSDGAETIFEYGPNNNVTKITEPIGKKTELKYDEMGNIIKTSVNGKDTFTVAADVYGRPVSARDISGKTIGYTYDADDNLISVIYPNGTIYYEYDGKRNCVSMKDIFGRVTKYEYSPVNLLAHIKYQNGAEENYEYDKLGRLTAKTDIRGNKVLYEYDTDGNLISITDSANNAAKYAYDKSSKLIKAAYSSGRELNYQYDEAGNLISVTDEGGLAAKYFYDPLNRINKVVDSRGNTTEYSYDSNDNVIKKTDQIGNSVICKYLDSYLIEMQDPYGGSAKYKYDNFGRLLSVSGKLGDIASRVYDEAGHPAKVKDMLGHTKSYGYDDDGNIAFVTDYNGNTRRYVYDTGGRLIETIKPQGDVFKIKYDDAEDTQDVTGPNGEPLMQYRYDKRGDLIQKAYSKETAVSYTYNYDSFGNLVSMETPDKNIVKYVYDKFQRLARIAYPNGQTEDFQYDKYNNLVSVKAEDFEETYNYDRWRRVIEAKTKNPDAVVKYEYDNFDRLIKITYPSGSVFSYSYNDLGRLTEINDKNNNKFIFVYDPQGLLASIQYPNGMNALYEYDPLGKIIRVEHKRQDGEILSKLIYNYDANGNVISAGRGAETKKYSYDADNELISDRPAASGYPGKYQYNSSGNIKNIGGIEFGYDLIDRLKTVKLPDGRIISYGYSPENKRIWKDDGNGRVYFIYSGDNLIAEVKDNKITAEYLFGPFTDQPLEMIIKDGVYYYHADMLGSVLLLTDSKQNAAASYSYGPWGALSHAPSFHNPFLFTGREYEPESNIYYFRARYYSPELGQFLTKDPYPEDLTDPLTFNPYIYAKNNPLTITDPFGTQGKPAAGPSSIFLQSSPPSSSSLMPPIQTAGGGGIGQPIPEKLPAPSANIINKPKTISPPREPRAIPVMSAKKPDIPKMSQLRWGDVREKPPGSPDVETGFPEIDEAPQSGGDLAGAVAGKALKGIANSINDMQKKKALDQINKILQAYPPKKNVPITMIVEGSEMEGDFRVIDKITVHRGGDPVNKLLRPLEWPQFREIIQDKLPGRGLDPDQIKGIMRQMAQIQNRIKGILSDAGLWERMSGQSVAGPKQLGATSQAASGQSAIGDIQQSQQQAIDKVGQKRRQLEDLQNRIQGLMNQYTTSGGRVGADWSNSWGSALNDWQRIIGGLAGASTAPSGETGGGSTTGVPDTGQYGSGQEGPPSGGQGSEEKGNNPWIPGAKDNWSDGPGSASDMQ